MTEIEKIFNKHKNYYEKVILNNAIYDERLFIFKKYNKYYDRIECTLIHTRLVTDAPSCNVYKTDLYKETIKFTNPIFDVDVDETVNYMMDRFNDSLNDVMIENIDDKELLSYERNITEDS